MKKRIKLTETQLHNVIRRCINEALITDEAQQKLQNLIQQAPQNLNWCYLQMQQLGLLEKYSSTVLAMQAQYNNATAYLNGQSFNLINLANFIGQTYLELRDIFKKIPNGETASQQLHQLGTDAFKYAQIADEQENFKRAQQQNQGLPQQ